MKIQNKLVVGRLRNQLSLSILRVIILPIIFAFRRFQNPPLGIYGKMCGNKLPFMISRWNIYCSSNFHASPGKFLVLSVFETSQTHTANRLPGARSVLLAACIYWKSTYMRGWNVNLRCAGMLPLTLLFEVNVCVVCAGRMHTHPNNNTHGWMLCAILYVHGHVHNQRGPLPYWSAYSGLGIDGRLDGRTPNALITHSTKNTHTYANA